ncbi:MAG: acetyl-CoA carboxylase biotin carboxyl carrier protein [Mycobacteriales bacterium]
MTTRLPTPGRPPEPARPPQPPSLTDSSAAPEPVDGAGGPPADLDQVRRQAVGLLADLERPPRTLRIRAGAITVDITWPDGSGGPGDGSGGAAEPAGTGADGVEAAADGSAVDHLTSPAVGVFYHAREPGAEPFVSVGETIRTGQQVGIIEAMKLMIPVEADRGGRVTAVLKANGQPVEYGEPLFALDAPPAGD